ncbi:MAG: toll/interleukin-1 receptor domain-containing protein [Clostridia bacterium]|nr:toll/interleukin-1 receptor domain-containing protein [Clostridia bacterium]
MKIFIIHRSMDKDRIKKLKQDIENVCNIDLLLLDSNIDNTEWFEEAKRKIKESDMILYALGETTHESPNVDDEINYALKKKKQILLIRLNPDQKDKINAPLFKKDSYNNTDKPLFKEIKTEDLARVLDQGYQFDVGDKLAETKDPKREADLIEQYKAYLATSEDVLTRRQNTSNFYTTLNTSILTLALTIAGLIFGLPSIGNSLLIASVITLAVSAIGVLLNLNWLSLLESYGRLNGAKIRVISEIEKSLPANIYNTEWKVMSEKLCGEKYVSFTSIEKRIPAFFTILFGLLFVASIVALIIALTI